CNVHWGCPRPNTRTSRWLSIGMVRRSANARARFRSMPIAFRRRSKKPTRSSDSDDAHVDGLEHGSCAVAHAQLRQQIGNVVLDRAVGDVEQFRDFLVAVAAGD